MNKSSVVANASFLIVYPGYFIYNTFVSLGYISSTDLSNHVVKSLFLVYLILFSANFILIIQKSIYINFILFLLFYMVFCTVFSIFIAPPGTLQQSISAIVSIFVIFTIGLFMDEKNKFMKLFIFISYFVICLLIFNLKDGVKFSPQYFSNIDDSATYQDFSLWATVTFIFTISIIKNYYIRLIFYVISLVAIYFLSARSELAGFVMSSFVVEYAYLARNKLFFFLSPIFVIFIIFSLYGSSDDIMYFVMDNIGWSRQLNIFDLEVDESWYVRSEFSNYSWGVIKSNPIFGSFGDHYYAANPPMTGAYAHNALSAWVNYGAVGFAIYLGLTVWAVGNSMFRFLVLKDETMRLSLFVNSFTLILIIFAKSVFWPLVALGWGLFVRQQFLRRLRHSTGIA